MRILLTLSLLFICLTTWGQLQVKGYNKGYNPNEGTITSEVIVLNNIPYNVYSGKYGYYVKTIDRKGMLTARFIGAKTNEWFNGYPVRVLLTGTKLHLKHDSNFKLEIVFLE